MGNGIDNSSDDGLPTGGLALVASTPSGGFALQDATPTILSWVAPNDDHLHIALYSIGYTVGAATTGGEVGVGKTGWGPVSAVSAGQGVVTVIQEASIGFSAIVLGPGETVMISQMTALTAGAENIYAQIWAQ